MQMGANENLNFISNVVVVVSALCGWDGVVKVEERKRGRGRGGEEEVNESSGQQNVLVKLHILWVLIKLEQSASSTFACCFNIETT